MDEFEQSLRSEKVAEWSSNYLNFSALQQQVDGAASLEDETERDKKKRTFQSKLQLQASVHSTLHAHKLHSAGNVDQEVKKVLAFFNEQQQQVDQEVQLLQQEKSRGQAYTDNLHQACEHIANLLQVGQVYAQLCNCACACLQLLECAVCQRQHAGLTQDFEQI